MYNCPDCNLLRKWGYGRLICLKCAEKMSEYFKAMGDVFAKSRDELILKVMNESNHA